MFSTLLNNHFSAINSSTASRNGHEEYEAVSIEASSKPSKADSALAKTDNVKTSGKGKEASVGKNAQTNKKSEKMKSMTFTTCIKLYCLAIGIERRYSIKITIMMSDNNRR